MEQSPKSDGRSLITPTQSSKPSPPPLALSSFQFIIIFVITLFITLLVSTYLPKLITFVGGFSDDMYIPAWYEYDAKETFFDNTAFTWLTDYLLAVLMSSGAVYIYKTSQPSKLRTRTLALLFLYATSVFVGAVCHQFWTTLDSMNTLTFRVLWTICSGTVAFAGGVIGSLGSELLRIASKSSPKDRRFNVVIVPDWVWYVWSLVLTTFVCVGLFSMKRPAADIFICGITQFTTSCYTFVCIASSRWIESSSKEIEAGSEGRETSEARTKPVVLLAQKMTTTALMLNAPLLPLYPFLVEMGLELGHVNAILHSWLALSWGMQMVGLGIFCQEF